MSLDTGNAKDFFHIRVFAAKLQVGLQLIDEAIAELEKLPSGRCLADVVYEELPEKLRESRRQLGEVAEVLRRVGA